MNPLREFHYRIPGFSQIAVVNFYNGEARYTGKNYMYWIPDETKLKRGDHLEVLVPNRGGDESKRVFVDQVIMWDESMTGSNHKRARGKWMSTGEKIPFVFQSDVLEVGYRVKTAIERIQLSHPSNAADQMMAECRQLTGLERNQLRHWWFRRNASAAMEEGNKLHRSMMAAIESGQHVSRLYRKSEPSSDDKVDALSFFDKYFKPTDYNRIKPKENSAMNTEIKIETITLITAPGINQQNADHLSDDQLITAISAANKQLHDLQGLVKEGNSSKKLADKIEKLVADITALTELVDARPAQ